MTLTYRIVIGMVAGLAVGLLLQWLSLPKEHVVSEFLTFGLIEGGGEIFISLLRMMVVPLVLVSLTCGAASLGATGRLGGKAIGLYLVTTAIAVTLALSLALIVDPGLDAGEIPDISYEAREAPSTKDTLVNIVPKNPIAAMADGAMLQIILFALLLGFSISQVGEAGARIQSVFEDLNAIFMKLITLVIELAPYGVFCLMVKLGVTVGWSEITKLLAYFLTVASALAIHMLVVYPTLLKLLSGLNPITYLKKMREPMLVAFSTSSSGATLPVTLRTVENRVGVSNSVASFAVPLGATINMDGTAIMQGVATVFIAQYYGIALGPEQLLMVVLTATMASIGTAAVPGVGLVMLAMVLDQVGLPVAGIGLIIGIDRLLDMMRTAVNVTGDGMVATVVAASEGELDQSKFDDPNAGRIIEPS
ncbi:MAG: cation:dicarboxylase symporter family transporter [Pseudomonadales bacterium]|nr:cation:dicarboxylase symporter family transporter [Pseudomonadales bacterium]